MPLIHTRLEVSYLIDLCVFLHFEDISSYFEVFHSQQDISKLYDQILIDIFHIIMS